MVLEWAKKLDNKKNSYKTLNLLIWREPERL